MAPAVNVMINFVLELCMSDWLVARETRLTSTIACKNPLGEHHRQAAILHALADA